MKWKCYSELHITISENYFLQKLKTKQNKATLDFPDDICWNIIPTTHLIWNLWLYLGYLSFALCLMWLWQNALKPKNNHSCAYTGMWICSIAIVRWIKSSISRVIFISFLPSDQLIEVIYITCTHADLHTYVWVFYPKKDNISKNSLSFGGKPITETALKVPSTGQKQF